MYIGWVSSYFACLNRHGFLIDVRKVLGHLTEGSYNWPSLNLILGEELHTELVKTLKTGKFTKEISLCVFSKGDHICSLLEQTLQKVLD